VRSPTAEPDPELVAAGLDAGEFDAILLAEEPGATDLILDDWQGRKEAARRNIPYLGGAASHDEFPYRAGGHRSHSEGAPAPRFYSPMTLTNTRFERWPSNSA
jgi:hypothetical protein